MASKDILTASGATVRIPEGMESGTPEQRAAYAIALKALGGPVVSIEVDLSRDTVLQIMEQMIVGTTLADSAGITYTLEFDNNWWDSFGNKVDLPPYEQIVSATMPGGWSWSKQ